MTTWLLLALGLFLAGGSGSGTTRPRPRARASPRTLEVIAAAATGIAAVAVLGVGRGLMAAVIAVPLIVVAVRRAHARPARRGDDPTLALSLDLVSIGLRTGLPLEAALLAAAPAAGDLGADLTRVAGLLRLGADPLDAWAVVAGHPALAPVAAAARRSATSGVRLAAAFEGLAGEVRAQRRAAGEARAQRVGVLAAAPLGLCFLPAFVCLGIVPALIGLAATVLH